MSALQRFRARLGGVLALLTGKHHVTVNARLRQLEIDLNNANKRLVRMGRQVGDNRTGLRASLRRIERDLGAVLRLQGIDGEQVPYPQRLALRRFHLMAQNEEDGIIYELVGRCAPEHRRFVELGCGSNGGNSGFLAVELGWKGLMVDGDQGKLATARRRFSNAKVKCLHSWITRDDVDSLITGAGLDGEVGMLSIDIDGNDYWLWKAISACSPRLVIIEYNSLFGPKQSVTVPYDESFDRHAYPKARDGKAIYFGASIEALVRLGRSKGYRLVTIEPRGVNAFFLRNDFRTEIPECSAKDCFRILDKYIGHDLTKLIEEHSLPLVEIPRADPA